MGSKGRWGHTLKHSPKVKWIVFQRSMFVERPKLRLSREVRQEDRGRISRIGQFGQSLQSSIHRWAFYLNRSEDTLAASCTIINQRNREELEELGTRFADARILSISGAVLCVTVCRENGLSPRRYFV